MLKFHFYLTNILLNSHFLFSIFFVLLAPRLLLFVWVQATTLQVEMSTMLPKLSYTLTMITLNLGMMLVSLYWKRPPLTPCQLNAMIIRKGLFCSNCFTLIYNLLSLLSDIAPVTLPSSAMSIPEGAMFVVSGWGTTTESGSISSKLR